MSQDWTGKDFYAVLGLPSGAPAAQIKKAYLSLARQHHPDTNDGSHASVRRFQNIGESVRRAVRP